MGKIKNIGSESGTHVLVGHGIRLLDPELELEKRAKPAVVFPAYSLDPPETKVGSLIDICTLDTHTEIINPFTNLNTSI